MELSKRIPSRIKRVRFIWAYKYFMECTKKYLEIRNGLHRSRKGTMTKCDWCKHPFEIGEWFGLANPAQNQEGPKRNWALCHDCCDLIKAPINPKYANQKDSADDIEEERYDCPIHGLQDGPECPRC